MDLSRNLWFFFFFFFWWSIYCISHSFNYLEIVIILDIAILGDNQWKKQKYIFVVEFFTDAAADCGENKLKNLHCDLHVNCMWITCELHVAQKSHSEKTEYLLQKLFPNSHENTCDGVYFSKYDEKFVLVKLIKEDCFWHEFSSEICEIFLKLFLTRVNILWLKNDDLYIPEEYLEVSQTSIRSFFDWVLNTPL